MKDEVQQVVRDVHDRKFASTNIYNLYIHSNPAGFQGITLTADNRYGIPVSEFNDNGSGIITVTNPASSRIPGVGYGFSISTSLAASPLQKSRLNVEGMIKKVREVKEME